MVAMETKIKHFKCISYHAKIIKFSFGDKDFLADLILKMIEKLMLENNFCCVRIADLSNSVFLFPWKPWTLHYK
jgi:hypothetical protein